MSESVSYAPGSRVRIRGEEWVVEKSLPVRTGGYAVHVQGLTELVQHHKAIFLDSIDSIEPLRPEDTSLVEDASPGYRQTRLFLETLLRRTPPTDDRVHVGHRAAIDPMRYQMVPVRKALGELRQRILIADGVGLGKTIEVGILLSELIKRGRGRRILVIAIRSMLAQFQQELWARFSLPLVRLDSEGIRRVHRTLPSNRSPFSHYDRAIISVDTLKNDGRYRAWLERTRWDAIVVDECHNVANKGSQRESLARLLAATCDTLVLTSATPHNGRAESFANLMRMLDPTSIADETDFSHADVAHLFERRFKHDVESEAGSSFSEREIRPIDIAASAEEEAALAALRRYATHGLGRRRHQPDTLFPWTLVKAFLSSPHACLESIDNRLRRVAAALSTDKDGPHPHAEQLERDAASLREVRALVERCAEPNPKRERLITELRAIGVDGSADSPRVVLFSERIATLEMLERSLTDALGLPGDAIQVFDASSLADKQQAELIESFGKKDSPLRVLLASDAASEGVNLHYFCHHLFHYDVPWSLIRLEQRMGRIDRYGQKHTPYLYYLLTRTDEAGADQLVVNRLIEKEKQVHKNLGEAGVVLGLYDADAEDEAITSAVARGESADVAIPEVPRGAAGSSEPLEGQGFDLMALFAQARAEAPKTEPLAESTAPQRSLYESDYTFAKTALATVEEHPCTGSSRLLWEADDEQQMLRLWAPESFRRWRQPHLPREAVPKRNEPYRLIASRDVVKEQIEAAREREGEWPAVHLLWEQHPLLEWLLDALAAVYARNEAPVLEAPRLGAQRAVFLFSALVSNEESQPILAEWFGVQLRLTADGHEAEGVLALDEVLAQTGLLAGLINPGGISPLAPALQARVPAAVELARGHVNDAYAEALKGLRRQVRTPARRLKAWQERSVARIDGQQRRLRSRHPAGLPKRRADELAEARRNVERFVKDQRAWMLTLVRHGQPHVRLAAVFAGGQ